jgi:NADH-quinone oxidoreductase subunit C
MTNDELPTLTVPAIDWKQLAHQLRYNPTLQFDFLVFLTCVDWKTQLGMVYHFYSYQYQHNLVIKITVDIALPQVDTISDYWPTANFHEREVYELFGVNFTGHPDMRLLILPDGWEGKNPLRKDFEDAVNMIKL